MAVEKNVTAVVRDGTVLRADLYHPDLKGKFPTIIERTPYDKGSFAERGKSFAERGYLYVAQDIRGRYASDGDFSGGFYRRDHTEADDGYDAIEWAAALHWSDGNVGTVGSSFDGWTQMELAPTRPPHLKAIVPQAICANLLDREMSGVLRLGRVLWWTTNTLPPDQRLRADAEWGTRDIEEANTIWTDRDRSKWLWYLPLREIPDEAMFGMGGHWLHWLDNHNVDNFGFEAKHKDVESPALVATSWYDQQIGSIKNFTGIRANGATEEARDGTRLIVGPWTHVGDQLGRTVGQLDFGPDAVRDYYEIVDQWFRYWLNGERDSGFEEWPRVQLFVMGANTWRGEDDWPLARTKYTDYYLHSSGSASTPHGDGVLSQDSPADEPTDEYVYDPRDPVMTLFSPPGQNEPHDQRALDGRRDVLVYATPPLEREVEVTGPITVTLHAASSARDTDFVVKLLDVWPDGFAQELCYGIVRARYRDSFDDPTLIEPGRTYEYTIQVNPTSNLFKAGHRIRIDVTSSDFPNFDRNHNTGGNDYAESTLVPASQTVFHDSTRPSRVTLPIIPR